MSTDNFSDTPYLHLATLGVLEREEGEPVELWMNGRGRVFIRAYNEGGQSWTHVDVLDLMVALRGGADV